MFHSINATNSFSMKQPLNKEIAEWLNRKGYLSVRGKKFRGAHVRSIVDKKILKEEKL